MSKRAVLYARVSSDDRGKDRRNLGGQLEMCRDYALKRGYTIVAELAEDDKGASGAAIDLPQLSRIRDLATAGDFDVLVVREIDRLSRRLAKQLIVEQELQRAGVKIEYVLGEYPDTPEGNFQKHVKAAVAEYEREKIKERNVRGRRNVVKNGRIMLHGNRPPYGYRVSEDGRNLVIYEPEARIVRLIFKWYTTGDESGARLSSYRLARRLTEMGVPTWADIHGIFHKKRARGGWSNTGVLDIIHNEVYKGQWHYGKRNAKTNEMNPREHWIALEVPSIIDAEIWAAAQVQCKRNNTEMDRNIKREYLMRYRLTCFCGYKTQSQCITARRKRTGEKVAHLYYRCNGKSGHTARKCTLPSFRTDQVDSAVWEWVKGLITEPEQMIEELQAQQHERERDIAPLRDRLATIENLLSEHKQQMERLLELYLSGEFVKELLIERKQQLEDVITALERSRGDIAAQIDEQTITDDQIQTIEHFAAKVRSGLIEAEKDFQKRRLLIELLDVRGVLTVEDGQKVIYLSSQILDASGEVILDNDNHYSKCGTSQRSSTE